MNHSLDSNYTDVDKGSTAPFVQKPLIWDTFITHQNHFNDFLYL